MLASLTVLGDTSLELTSASSNDEDGTVSLRSTRNHVLNEVTMARRVNDLVKRVKSPNPIDIISAKESKLTVTMYFGVSNFQRAISIVIPRSRSAFSLSSTHAGQPVRII